MHQSSALPVKRVRSAGVICAVRVRQSPLSTSAFAPVVPSLVDVPALCRYGVNRSRHISRRPSLAFSWSAVVQGMRLLLAGSHLRTMSAGGEEDVGMWNQKPSRMEWEVVSEV